MSGLLTCITCSVGFKEADSQRDHYKTDWHRYNLKRKVAELPPVAEPEFKSRMDKHEEQRKIIAGEIKAPTGYCVSCSKSFANEKAFENHLKSKKHLEALRVFNAKENKEEIEKNRRNRKTSEAMEEDDIEVEEVDSDEWDEDEDLDEADIIAPTNCLFCLHQSSSIEKNLVHMSDTHSFFLPDCDFIVDLDGLMNYLGAKVGQGKMCLYCAEKSKQFRSLDAVRKHMVDKGHCKIAFSGGDAIAEFADFYDYSKSYPDNDQPDQDPDAEVDIDALDDTGYELVLPSGAKIGHRSLMRYYRQSINPNRELVVRKPNQKVLDHYRSFGVLITTSQRKEAQMRAKDLSYFRKQQQKYHMKLGVSANKLQKYWRDPTM